jgi:hypothetical protein
MAQEGHTVQKLFLHSSLGKHLEDSIEMAVKAKTLEKIIITVTQ